MIVYRLEDTQGTKRPFENVGCGVYGGSSVAYRVATCSDDSDHPCPTQESLLQQVWDLSYVCCFKSLSELHRWFDLLLDVEKDSDLYIRTRIVTYVVDDKYFYDGRFQSIAKGREMVLVESHDCYYKG